jgi:hypothetical protein
LLASDPEDALPLAPLAAAGVTGLGEPADSSTAIKLSSTCFLCAATAAAANWFTCTSCANKSKADSCTLVLLLLVLSELVLPGPSSPAR